MLVYVYVYVNVCVDVFTTQLCSEIVYCSS